MAAALGLAPAAGGAQAQTQTATPPPLLGPDVSGDTGPPWLNHLLDALKPSIDTRLPESIRATYARLEGQIADGHAADALAEIDRRLDDDKRRSPETTDVQLLFLKAYALDRLGRREEAKALYRQMTERFPELPEPWNNLAALEAADGRLDEAKTALDMAVRTDPGYTAARENLGDLYMMLAARSYGEAGKLDPNAAGAREKREGIKSLLEAPGASGTDRNPR
ncbi:hypothetical protein GCM10023144_27420 [Pigmentiphaga soli]|uniref:Tetratricopeptide repeat protein n=1 Tax=Pigmentiphaga soli TaxID=1007095 RepID=A0ABP8H6I1_9BURK